MESNSDENLIDGGNSLKKENLGTSARLINKNKKMTEKKEYKINNYITLKLVGKKTFVYVNGERFLQCVRLVLNIHKKDVKKYDQIDSIDEASKIYDKHLYQNRIVQGPYAKAVPDQTHSITPETEFWGHCSNLQAWEESGYDTRLLRSNLAFPLLKKLVDAKDPKALKVFKEEIAERFLSGFDSVVNYLIYEGFLNYLETEELQFLFERSRFEQNTTSKWEGTNLSEIWDNIASTLHSFGNTLLEQGKITEAIKIFRFCIKYSPSNIHSFLDLGYIYALTKDYKNAIEIYSYLVNCKSRSNLTILSDLQKSEALNNLAFIFNNLKEYNLAIEACLKSIEINNPIDINQPAFFMDRSNIINSTSNAYNQMGLAFFQKMNCEKAIECYKKALLLQPHNNQVRYNLANIYMSQERYDETINRFQKITDSEPIFRNLNFKKKTYEYRIRNGSVRNLSRTLTFEIIIDNIFEIIVDLKNIEKKWSIVKKNPSTKRMLYNLGMYYKRKNKIGKAIKAFKYLIKCDSNYEKGYFHLLELYYKNRNYNKAIDTCKHYVSLRDTPSIKNYPNVIISVLYILGSSYLKVHESGKAKAVFKKVLRKDPENRKALKKLGIMQLERKTYSKKVIIIGLDNSGKSSILNVLMNNCYDNLVDRATRGISYECYTANNTKFWVWDFGGAQAYRERYLNDKHGIFYNVDEIIYVIDINDPCESFLKAVRYLGEVTQKIKSLNEPSLVKLYVLLHKADPNVIGTPETVETIEFLIKKIKTLNTPINYEICVTSLYNYRNNYSESALKHLNFGERIKFLFS